MACPTCETVEYRDIPGFPGYCVGDDGSVWSCLNGRYGFREEWRRLKPSAYDRTGHVKVYLCRDGEQVQKPVHQIVLLAFVGPCPPGHESCHFPDRDPGNCALSNLRYGTRSDNVRDMIAHGTHYSPFARGPSVDARRVRAIRRRRSAKGESMRKLAECFGIPKSTIHQIIARKGVYEA